MVPEDTINRYDERLGGLEGVSLSRRSAFLGVFRRGKQPTRDFEARVFAMQGHVDVTRQKYTMTARDRAAQKQQVPVVVWLTGLPGSGKSTLADAVERRLNSYGMHTMVLDGDNVRSGLNNDLSFTPADRHENVRRVGEVARLLCDAGLITIVALVSPFEEDRAIARSLFDPGDFIEVFVETPPEVCAERDPKGLYKKAAAGQITNLTGVGQGYEPPAAAEVHAHGDGDLDANADLVLEAILSRQVVEVASDVSEVDASART